MKDDVRPEFRGLPVQRLLVFDTDEAAQALLDPAEITSAVTKPAPPGGRWLTSPLEIASRFTPLDEMQAVVLIHEGRRYANVVDHAGRLAIADLGPVDGA